MQSRSWKSHEDINFNFYNPHIHHGIFGNALIILALRKLSSLHSPSKILISCLACTDLGVGLISNPLLNGYYLSPEHSKSCHYFWALSYTATTILCGASLSTTTAISVDRLLALLLGLRYRQVVTVRRVMALVVTMWLSSILIAAVVYYSYLIALGMASAGLVLCIVISTFCYTKICHTLRLSRARSARPRQSRTTKWRRIATEQSKVQKDSVHGSVDTNDITGLLSPIWFSRSCKGYL